MVDPVGIKVCEMRYRWKFEVVVPEGSLCFNLNILSLGWNCTSSSG